MLNGKGGVQARKVLDGGAGPVQSLVSVYIEVSCCRESLKAEYSLKALNPNQTCPVSTSLAVGAHRLERAADGRALLPEFKVGDETLVGEMLEALIQCAWGKVLR